jgi:hypothetical protein
MAKFRVKLGILIGSCLLVLMLGSPIMACGTVDGWVSVYKQGEKHKALFHMLDCPDSYHAPEDDIALLAVVKDALQNGSKIAEMGATVFRYYNHLWGARNQPGYQAVLKIAAGMESAQALLKYENWMIVTARNGANVRAKPSLDGRVITAVKRGMQVQVLSKHGDWLEIKPVGPGSVDPRFEHKQGYVHKSLLKPY